MSRVGYEHIGHTVAVRTVGEVGRTGAVAVGPIDFAVGMVAGHIVVEAVVGSIDSAVAPDPGTETLVIAESLGTEAVGLAEGEVACYSPVAPGGMAMRAHHMELEQAVARKVTAGGLAIQDARAVVAGQAPVDFDHMEVVAQDIVMADRRCSWRQGWRMRSSRKAA